MGLLDQVIGGLVSGSGGGASPIQGVLANLLGGGQAPAAGYGGQQGGTAGGLGSLIASFEQAGLGHIAQSWIGNGANQSVSPDQLQNVLGADRVQSMAGQAGMGTGDFLSQLSQHLPNVVSAMTPNGRLPDEGTVSV